jgi:DNA topoisomerase-1
MHTLCRVTVEPMLEREPRMSEHLTKPRANGAAVVSDPVKAADRAHLKYVEDDAPGIRRHRRGREFEYFTPRGNRLRKRDLLARIRSLAIPPAWEDVWICPKRNGHLQATGRDARGRKQYRYHPRWREARDDAKYQNVIDFARALPRIRRRVDRDLRRRGLHRRKVLAAIVRLLETTLIRVGNEEYARTNHSFGLTTMRDRHADVTGHRVRFDFRGKSGIEHEIDLEDARLAAIVRRCQELPGQQLFQYLDSQGEVHDVGSADVNDYLREISGRDFTAKDFRTWAGTALAAQALREFEDFDSQAAAKRNITRAIERVAQRLGNTQAVCRKCYVHPAVIDAYLDRSLVATLKARTERELRDSLPGLPAEEAAVLALLQQRMERQLQRARRAATTRSTDRRHPRKAKPGK